MTNGFDADYGFERDFQRYLAAKRTVDDRAIDRRTLDRLRTELDRLKTDEHPDVLDVLDVGTGIGATIERMLALDELPRRVEYTAVDLDPANVEIARQRLPDVLAAEGYDAVRTDDGLRFERGDRTVSLELVAGDAVEVVSGELDRGRTWDLLVGHAVLDVIGPDALAVLLGAVPGGYCYFPITFDGATRFGPPHDLDAEIERRYHRHLDRKPAGRSRAGHPTLDRLCRSAAEVLAVGGSDWVVYPGDSGYPGDEAYFLHYIVDTVARSIADDAAIDDGPSADTAGEDPAVDDGDPDDPVLDESALRAWATTRHRQVDEGRLTYVTHQLDVLARVPDSGLDAEREY